MSGGGGMGFDINSSKSYAKTDASASKSGDIRTGDKNFYMGGSDQTKWILAAVAVAAIYFIFRK